MQVLKGPRKTVLDGSILDKPILIGMDQSCDEGLKPISEELNNDFD
jgi:hypothetical protein